MGAREESFVRVGALAEIPDGDIRGYELPQAKIAVANVSGRLFAFGEECTHKGCLLSEGSLDRDDTVVCPDDGSAFDMNTGEAVQGPAEEPIPVYQVRVQDGWVEVALP